MRNQPVKASKMSMDEARWRAESDLETLMKADEIRADAKRLAAAKRMANDKLSAMQSAILGKNKDGKQ